MTYPALISSEFSAVVNCDSLFLLVSLSNLGGSRWSYDLISLMDVIRVVDFSVSSAFYFIGQSGKFQISYMLDQNLIAPYNFHFDVS